MQTRYVKKKEHAVPQLYATRTDFLKMLPQAVRNRKCKRIDFSSQV